MKLFFIKTILFVSVALVQREAYACRSSAECVAGQRCFELGENLKTCLPCAVPVISGAYKYADDGEGKCVDGNTITTETQPSEPVTTAPVSTPINIDCETSIECNSGYRCYAVEPVTLCLPCSFSSFTVNNIIPVDDGSPNCGEDPIPTDSSDNALEEVVSPSSEPVELSESTPASSDEPSATQTGSSGASSGTNLPTDDGDISSPTPTPASVCIDAEALSHLPDSHLVFRRHFTAHVLCDENGSCATHGHLVVYNDIPMMMSTYCDVHANCTSRKMLVNSPKMARGLRVPSKTDGLQFSALSARYETSMEETMLRALVGAGF